MDQEVLREFTHIKANIANILKELGLTAYNNLYNENLNYSLQSLQYQLEQLLKKYPTLR